MAIAEGCRCSPESLSGLVHRMHQLRMLSLRDCQVRDSEVATIVSNLSNIEELDFSNFVQVNSQTLN